MLQNGKIGFINSFAEIIIPPKYDSFTGKFTSPESMIVVYRDNMCGVLNTNGLEILMGEYQNISLVGTQYAIVMNFEYQKGLVEIMTNQITIPFGEYHNFNYYNNILIARKQLLKGLITPTGKQLTPIQYRWISGVVNGLLRVIIKQKTDDIVIKKWGLIDIQGHEVLPAIYDNISPIRNNGSIVYAVKDNKTIKFDISNITQRANIE
ncbi:MAG: WG repeat-containing protein [Prevotellaceae bacterium]|nr:WG repeat-containing protein [Prevotellaceae bacterium]